MFPKNSVKPLELVVNAIHCLGEKKGSSPQNILRFVVGKYNVDADAIKPHIQKGLKRGIIYGMIIQKCGLYRLNNNLSNPLGLSLANFKKVQKILKHKSEKPLKKPKKIHVTRRRGKRRFFKPFGSSLRKGKRKTKKSKDKRKKLGGPSKYLQNGMKKRKQTGQKTKLKKQKITKEKVIEMETKSDSAHQSSENVKNDETPSKII